jgi:hypothetical protein
MLIVASATPLFITLYTRLQSPVALFASAAAAIVGVETARHVFVSFRARRQTYAALAMGVGMFALVGVLYGFWIARVPQVAVSQRVATILRQERATDPGQVVMIGYKEPSLAFYQGGTIREADIDLFTRTDPLLWPRWAVISDAAWSRLPIDVRERFETVDSVAGLWYANQLKWVEVFIVRRK